MSEAELLEIINLHAGNAITSFTVFVTFLFGYMTAAYFVGAKLTFLQVMIVSLIYTFACAVWAVSTLTHAHSFETLIVAHPNFVPSPLWGLPWSRLVALLTSATLVASLYFMYDVCSREVEPDVQDT